LGWEMPDGQRIALGLETKTSHGGDEKEKKINKLNFQKGALERSRTKTEIS